MYQNYNYYPQQSKSTPPYLNYAIPQTTQYQPAILKGHQVASIDEARVSTIDFDGSIFYFPDLANRRIYTKQINMDGTASLNVYELKELPLAADPNPINNFVTREEFETAIAQLKTAMTPTSAAPQTAPPQPKLEVMQF